MTVPHDEQPLTRRQLRDLERQKPRKQQKEEAKAAEEAEAKRKADDAARAAADRAAFEAEAARAVIAAPAAVAESAPTPDAPAPAEPATEAPEAAVVSTPGVVVPDAEPAVVGAAPVDAAPNSQAPDAQTPDAQAPVGPPPVADTVAPAPILSRRARRALSADHPLAEPAGDSAVAGAAATAGVATGPIIAEIMPDEPADEAEVLTVEEHTETAEVEPELDQAEEAPAATQQPMVEELMVVDADIAPEILAEEEEELAEIDDTPAPEPVHIVTIDETPSAPVLAPLFQAPAPEQTKASITPTDLAPSSFDDLIATRGIGSSNSVTSTSALVLPSVPNHGDVGTALDETGEVIITGSIDLPMSLGSTGAAPADGLESSELDAFLDPESEVGSDVAPVSATRAVSTHGPSSGLVAPPKRRGTNAPLILAITAGVLAVGVVGLLLAAFVFRIF